MAKSCCNRNGNACLPKTVFDETQAYEPLILENLEISSGSYDTLQNIQHSDFFYKNTPSRKGDQGDCKIEHNQTYERLTSERDLNQHIYDSTHQDPECMSGNHLNSMPTSGVCYSQYTNSEKKRAEVKQDVYYSELQTQISCSCDLYESADGKSMNLTHCSIPSKHLTSSYKKQTPFKSQRGKYYACFVFGFLLVGFIAGVTVFLLLKNNSQDLHKKNIQTPVDLITTEASTTRKMTSCQQLRSSTKDFSSDFYIPECTKTGEFEKRQCEGKVGSKTCWCVDPNGREIPGSQMTEPEVPDCHEGRNLKPCVFELLKSSSGLLGARQARCTFDGEYEEIQCHVRECWCVDKNGIERMGTRVFMTTWKKSLVCEVDLITTEASTTRKMTSCQQLRSSTKDFSSDFYIPECTKTGEFEKRQCEGKVGSKTCWCVDPNGREIPGSQMTEPEVPDCYEGRNLKPCVFESLKSSRGLLGARQIRCSVDGEYEKIKCNVKECWCVDKKGIEIMGTREFMTTWERSLDC